MAEVQHAWGIWPSHHGSEECALHIVTNVVSLHALAFRCWFQFYDGSCYLLFCVVTLFMHVEMRQIFLRLTDLGSMLYHR